MHCPNFTTTILILSMHAVIRESLCLYLHHIAETNLSSLCQFPAKSEFDWVYADTRLEYLATPQGALKGLTTS